MNAILDKLEELTKGLSFLDPSFSGFFELSVRTGRLIGFTLFKNDSVAIVRSFGEKGTVLPLHCHVGSEWYGVYSGKARIEFEDGTEKVLSPGEACEIAPGRGHRCVCVESTWAWVVLSPPENFPPRH